MPRKGENIYKRKDGRWDGRYIRDRDLMGNPIRGYVYAKTYRDIKVKLAEAIASSHAENNHLSSKEPPKFEEIAKEWFDMRKSQVKLSTQNKYRNLLYTYILPSLENQSIQLITHDVLESFCNTLLIEGGLKHIGLSQKQ